MRPLVDGIRVRWIGTVAGQERNSLVASARVALFPLTSGKSQEGRR